MDLESQLQASLGDTYALERELGAGGMARVFVAKEVALGRSVVVKVLPPEMSSAVLSERFRREISLAAQLRHPHIIPLLTAGDVGGLLYYTMPFVEGETLRVRLARGDAIPASEGIRIIREIAYALSYAHGHGVVHRDIKPENILIENGHAVVADFGVAKALAIAAGSNESAVGSLTSAGIAMGTATYMAPEQAAADPAIDHRADLYSLGVVAYEIFAGAPPFTGSAHQVIAAHMVSQPEPLAATRLDVPPALGDLVMHLLAKNPADRPQSAADVVHMLDAIAAGEISSGEPAFTRTPRMGASDGMVFQSRSQRIPRVIVAAAIALALAAAGYGGYVFIRAGKGMPPGPRSADSRAINAASRGNSVAVLPFVNTTGDTENEHFSTGLTDELISALGHVRGLKVVARTSVFALSGKGLSARAIADSLGVGTVIEGSARRAGNRLKVTTQLVGATDGTVLWSQAFDRQMTDVFAIQEEIARAIVGALNVHLTEDERSRLGGRPTDDLEAYDLYLKGRFSWSKRSREGIEAALAYFQNAVRLDPKFALSYAGMADAYVTMSNFNYMPVGDALGHAQIAADRALALDSSLSEAHVSKGFVLASHGKFAESEEQYYQGIQLNPSYPTGHHFYSLLLMMVGRLDDATAQNRLTISLDPLSVPGNANRGIILCQQRKYADARRALQQALPLSTGNALAPYYLGVVEAADGRYSDALLFLGRAHRIAPGFPGVKGALAYTNARVGRGEESDAILAELRAAATDDRSRIQLALAEAVMGNLTPAYTILAKPTKWDIPTLIELRADPLLASFRADPRYPRLLAGIGLRP